MVLFFLNEKINSVRKVIVKIITRPGFPENSWSVEKMEKVGEMKLEERVIFRISSIFYLEIFYCEIYMNYKSR